MMDDEHDFDSIADFDQALATVRDLAALLHGFYVHLRSFGFTDDQAMRLVLGYQQGVIDR